jgi:hypothetical protein
MRDIAKMDFDNNKILNIIQNYKDLNISSFSLKILLGQLKVKLEINNTESTKMQCIKEVNDYFEKYKDKLPNVKNDLITLNLVK